MIKIVGVGAKDDLAFAARFVAETGTTFTMLWSDSFEPWRHFGVTRNSTVLLLDGAGKVVDGSASSFDAQDVRDQLAGLA